MKGNIPALYPLYKIPFPYQNSTERWFATSDYSAIAVDLIPSFIQHVFDLHQRLHDIPTLSRESSDNGMKKARLSPGFLFDCLMINILG
jgi:hypothetical protein